MVNLKDELNECELFTYLDSETKQEYHEKVEKYGDGCKTCCVDDGLNCYVDGKAVEIDHCPLVYTNLVKRQKIVDGELV